MLLGILNSLCVLLFRKPSSLAVDGNLNLGNSEYSGTSHSGTIDSVLNIEVD